MFHFEKHSQPFFLCVSSDKDLIFLGQATHSQGIKIDLQKKKKIFYIIKNTLKKPNTCKKIHNIYKCWIFYIDILIFPLQNATNTFYNLYQEDQDLINKFWPCSSKCNTFFNGFGIL